MPQLDANGGGSLFLRLMGGRETNAAPDASFAGFGIRIALAAEPERRRYQPL